MADDEEFPQWLKARRPELAELETALADWRAGKPETTRCRYCGTTIHVTEVAATGTLAASCEKGCSSFRARRGKP